MPGESAMLSMLSALAVALAPALAAASGVLDKFECVYAATQLSCHADFGFGSPALCCYNGPIEQGGVANGLFLSTQFWDTDPATGPSDSTTIHGLWPDRCDGSYDQYCTNKTGVPEYTGAQIRAVIAQYDPHLLAYMDEYYKSSDGDDEAFWEHEYNKHGTCISTMRTQCQPWKWGISQADFAVLAYFRQIVHRFMALPTIDWLADAGIVPGDNATYALADVQSALAARHGGVPYIGCTDDGAMDEFWYYFFTRGPVTAALFVPTDTTANSSCPSTVKFP